MTSRNKNFRRRSYDSDSAPDSDAVPPPRPLSFSSSSGKPKLLSFADDDDATAVDTHTTTSSHRPPRLSHTRHHLHKLTSSRDRLPSSSPAPAPAPSNVQPQAGEYTKERIRELQKNTRSLAPSKAPPPSEPLVVLKGLLKPPSSSPSDSDAENPPQPPPRKTDPSLARPSIPDQATINLIRAKRERLRQSRSSAATDYISLDAGTGLRGESDDDGDFQGRVSLKAESPGGKGVFESIEGRAAEAEIQVDGGLGGDGESDEDAEEKIWEEEQFRKGLGKRMESGAHLVGNGIASPATVHGVQLQPFPYTGSGHHLPGPPSVGLVSGLGTAGVTRSAEVMSISQQAEVATKALQDSVMRLKETHGRTMSSMLATDENLSASLSNITALEKSLSAAGEKFIFMQKLRDFVSVICDFLQHKAPYIEELEEEMQKLHEERASAILERRAADNADEMMEVEPAVRAAMSVFSKGGGPSAITAAATAAQAASTAARERSNFPLQLDEFGRDVNQQKRLDSVRRADVRKRRKARSELKRLPAAEDGTAYRIEGESSTDESDSESTAYKSSHDELLQTAEQIFSDAADEFSKLSAVKEVFEKWKRCYSSSYRDAYMSLSVPAIFSPYVRLELLKWDPLYEDKDFNNMQWHNLLFDYGLPTNGGEFDSDDADADLIPQLIEKVALPILHHEIAHCWDMLSTRGTRNAVSATSLVINYVPASSEALQELLGTIRSRLADAVADLTVPNWGINVIKAVPNAARIAAYRFGMSIRLLKNICLWKDILALHILEKLALDELLSGKVLPHIRSIAPNIHDAITRTERVVVSLSGVWSGRNVTSENGPKLQPLVLCVMTLGKILEEKHASGARCREETLGLARRLKRMLVDLNEYDKARVILRTFQLKEAL